MRLVHKPSTKSRLGLLLLLPCLFYQCPWVPGHYTCRHSFFGILPSCLSTPWGCRGLGCLACPASQILAPPLQPEVNQKHIVIPISHSLQHTHTAPFTGRPRSRGSRLHATGNEHLRPRRKHQHQKTNTKEKRSAPLPPARLLNPACTDRPLGYCCHRARLPACKRAFPDDALETSLADRGCCGGRTSSRSPGPYAAGAHAKWWRRRRCHRCPAQEAAAAEAKRRRQAIEGGGGALDRRGVDGEGERDKAG